MDNTYGDVFEFFFSIFINKPLKHNSSKKQLCKRNMNMNFIFSPESSNTEKFSANQGAVWVKIVSSWLCGGLYLWTLVAPIVLQDRDFGYN